MNDDPTFVPSTPNADLQTLVAAILRQVGTVLATLGVVHGTLSDSVDWIIAGAIVGIASASWSLWEKVKAARLDHQGSARSAVTGSAVRAR